MSDLTVYAEALIATVARAFYDDEAVCIIDVLIRDKFLRDDDMAPRLQLPAKRLRATLQFLTEEHLVRSETVDDLAQGGSQATKFYYLDYNRSVHSIRLRLHLLRKKLEHAELRARSSSFYLCPGYKLKRCNGRYTEEEAQQVLDTNTGLFLCQECARNYQNDPNGLPVENYTLQLVDNTKELKEAMDNLRRVNVQLSSKFIGSHQLRTGIYDLLQKVRGKGKVPITSNLPSENFALGIGSKRLAGTGRTAGIKAKKLEQKGMAESAAQARHYLVGGGSRQSGDGDLMFLKNAMGQELHFCVERGGGARAQLLATARRRRRKLMDAAASRVGAMLPLYIRVEESRKRKIEQEKHEEKKNTSTTTQSLEFLNDNLGDDEFILRDAFLPEENSEPEDQDENTEPELVLADDLADIRQIPEESRIAAFQSQYKKEMDRQVKILGIYEGEVPGSPNRSTTDDDDRSIVWEDGDI